MTLAFLHSAAVHVDTFDRLATSADPSVPLRHVVRDDLFANVLATGEVTPDVAAAVRAQVTTLVDEGARVVVCTCSTLGNWAETTPVANRAAVLRVDRPLAEQVVAGGQRILVAAATPSAMRAAVDLLRGEALRQKRPLELEELACDAAWPLFLTADHESYAAQIAELVENRALPGDQVMLAQASMAPSLPLMKRNDIQVYATPTVGVRAALASYHARACFD
jgi:hypothetical protein